MRVDLYKNGVCIDMGMPISTSSANKKLKKKKKGGKRKKLTGKYSAASFRRMREYCIMHDCPSLPCWGVTLTVPGTILGNVEFKRIVHKLTVYCNYYEIILIWRCELQQRGQPHLHLVVYGNCISVCRLMAQWQRLICKTGVVLNLEQLGDHKEILCVNRGLVTGSQHMFDVQLLKGDYRSWRYLVAHASKGKRCQLGWQGRQWGVVCRHLLVELDARQTLYLEDREMYTLRRWVRRASYRRIGNYGRHFVLVNPQTVAEMVDYIRDDYFGAPLEIGTSSLERCDSRCHALAVRQSRTI